MHVKKVHASEKTQVQDERPKSQHQTRDQSSRSFVVQEQYTTSENECMDQTSEKKSASETVMCPLCDEILFDEDGLNSHMLSH